MNTYSCNQSLANTGATACAENINAVKMIVSTPVNFSFASLADFKLLSKWREAIEQTSNRIYPMPIFINIEPQDEETQYNTSGDGSERKVREGKNGYRGALNVSTCVGKNLRKFNNKKRRIFEFYENGFVGGTSPDGTKVMGYLLNNFEVEKLPSVDNASIADFMARVRLDDPTEKADRGVFFNPSKEAIPWTYQDVEGLLDVDLTTSAPSVAGVTVAVTGDCDGDGVLGLTEISDWSILDDAAGTETITGVTDNGNGSYTLAATLTAGDYTVNLVSPASLGVDGYESTGAASFTVSA